MWNFCFNPIKKFDFSPLNIKKNIFGPYCLILPIIFIHFEISPKILNSPFFQSKINMIQYYRD